MRKDAHREQSLHTEITMCGQNLTRKRHACFNLALLTHFADPAQIRAKSPIHSKRDQTKVRLLIAKNCADHVTERTGKLHANVATFAAPLRHRPTSEARHLVLRTARPAALPMHVATPNCCRRFAKVPQSRRRNRASRATAKRQRVRRQTDGRWKPSLL